MLSPLQILKKYWGFDQFRSLQADVIDSVLEGRDTVALLHTGAGKSVCYQVPALCLPGKTLVISPLIALMQDQVDALNKKGVLAKAIFSGLKHQEVDLILDNFMNGPLKILYVSPERLETVMFIERFKKTKISLIAIDESHCISQWGQDFRPAYYNIKSLREWHPDVPFIAVTATATPKVVVDITEKLEMVNPNVITSTFARDNLSFTVMLSEDKMDKLSDFLSKMKGSGIIYMRSRKKVEQLASYLNKDQNPGEEVASYYHGGLNMKTRMRVQNDWIENRMKIIVCTNAFGMGVDKPDVRFVVHCDIPPSIEEYYQEAGRAGRDGKPSHAVSIINFGDIVKLQQHHLSSYPSLKFLEQVYNRLCSYLKVGYGSGAGESFDLSLESFCNQYRYHIGRVFSCLNIMEKEGWLFLNQAMRKPSQIVFTSAKGRISLSSRNKDIKSKIILHFIRKYEGIFTDFVMIDEGKIANELNIPLTKLITELKVMDKETILAYHPSTDQPRITFLMDRPAPNSFAIDEVTYRKREQNAANKMRAIQEYMTSFDCRQQTILSYFGEEKEQCGRCDICLGSKVKIFNEVEKSALLTHLRKVAKNGEIHCDSYIRLWPFNKQNKAFAILQQLHIEREIYFDRDSIIQTNPKATNAI